jgi:uncharacterized low-complexity protein
MSRSRKPLPLIVAVAAGSLVVGSLFTMDVMAHGYMQDAQPAAKAAEGKCGGAKAAEGKCGGAKAAEGKCGGAKAAEGKCGGAKAAEGKCGGAKARKRRMADMDTDKDGKLSRAEFAAAHGGEDEKFAAHDGNSDGFITQAEMDAHHAQMKAGEGKCGGAKATEGKCGGKQ